MGYSIKCLHSDCNSFTWATNIVELIQSHTNSDGRLICVTCGKSGACIYAKSDLQEKGEIWERWIKGVIRLDTGVPTYSPYVLLTADEEEGPVTGFQFSYYKDVRTQGGKLKHGHGPGGTPVLGKEELLRLLDKLISFGCLSADDLNHMLTTRK